MQNISQITWSASPTEPRLTIVRQDGDSIDLTFTVTEDLFQLQGHFPGEPVLPGVAQVDWAVKFARHYLGMTGEITRLGQLKFSQLIVGGSHIRLNLDWRREAGRLYFTYHEGEKTCSTGFFELTAP
jgi:3-hydroxymyristoyl/3-hydroxydecanoyl-(acyl carrier protein) dehydratase|tara:strand:+ start:620 stop:1000 length:381 start_codon:yes stop_codon:yes gene_type:complete